MRWLSDEQPSHARYNVFLRTLRLVE